MNSRSRILVLLAAFLASSASAQESLDKKWQIDNNHSAAQFAVKHLGLSTVRGRFNKMNGTAQYDPANPAKTSIDVSIDAASIDTRIEMRDRDLRSAKWFDVEKFPVLTFKSKRVEAGGAGRLKVTGDLTIKGTTREVVLDVDTPTPPLKDPRGSERVGTSATTRINRQDFGVGGTTPLASDDVAITIDIELVKPASSQ